MHAVESRKALNSRETTFNSSPTPSTSTAEERKAVSQRRQHELRQKLLAKRQNTPQAMAARQGTPSKIPPTALESKIDGNKTQNKQEEKFSDDAFGLESLLAEGKAAAEAQTACSHKTDNAAATIKQTAIKPHDRPEQSRTQSVPTGVPQVVGSVHVKGVADPIQSKQLTQLADPYYDDLATWLDFTGYHDVEYRTAKLSIYKERRTLELEAARIAERLEKLKQVEASEMQIPRSSLTHVTFAGAQPPPALPGVLPIDLSTSSVQPAANGTKRAHSPDSVEKSARRRDEADGMRIRGANGSSESRRDPPKRQYSPAVDGLERRISYPNSRRASLDVHHKVTESRDPSLERRNFNYRQDGRPVPVPVIGYADDRHDVRAHDYAARGGYGGSQRARREHGSQYRGSAGLDPKRGVQSSSYQSYHPHYS